MTATSSKKPEPYHHGDLKAAVLKRSAEIISEKGIEALSLRAVARDLGVSHGAPNRHFKSKSELLSALVTDIWNKMRDATLRSAAATETENPYVRLNALGRGYLRWALENKSEFQAMSHPDLRLYTDNSVKDSQIAFNDVIKSAVQAAQAAGRHADIDPVLVTLYTTSVPFGAAMLVTNALMRMDDQLMDQEALITGLINLVVPV